MSFRLFIYYCALCGGWAAFFGWMLGRAYWGRGYATEAATAVRDYGFAEVAFSRLISLIHPANAASIRVAEKLGMAQESTAQTRFGRVLLYATSSLE